MPTSKEIIERTGISRATLNNYIAAGLVARPDVLPPGPDDGAAPRIGYFPEGTIERIAAIQQLKREGWTMSRIAEHFAHGGDVAPPAAPVAKPTLAARASSLGLQLAEAGHPAYLVDEDFRLAWANPAAAASALSPLAGAMALPGDAVIAHLVASSAPGAHAILRFHLAVAKDRGIAASRLASPLPPEHAARLGQLHDEVRATSALPVAHVSLAASGAVPLRLGFAVHFRDHVLFTFAPAGQQANAPARAPSAAPALVSMAIVVATLEDAPGLWSRLAAHEYFELANEVGSELEAIFRRHRGVLGRHPGEGIVGYFLRDAGDAHLWNALSAAHAARQALREISRRWEERKQWDVPVAMNIGVDEGEEWMGAIGADEMRVLGDAAERAAGLALSGRHGSILVTRALLGKFPAAERNRIAYGAPRGRDAAARSLHTFAPLSRFSDAVPARLAEVPVAEILDLHAPGAP